MYSTTGWWEHATDLQHGYKVLAKNVDRQRVRASRRQLWCDSLTLDTSKLKVTIAAIS